MLDSRALKNVMPIKFMKILGLETTKTYSKQLGGFIPWPWDPWRRNQCEK